MGPAVAACIRTELRRRWTALVALALLVSVAVAVVVASAAGARRTASAFDRLSDATLGRHLSIQVDRPELTDDVLDGVAALPSVSATGRLTMFPVLPDPEQVSDDELDLAIFASPDGGWGRDVDRGIILEGRRPDPAEPYEVALNEVAATQTGLRVGDTLDVSTFTPADLDFVFSGQGFQGFNGPQVTLDVVGVLRRADDLAGSASEVGPTLVGTPAFARRHADDMGGLTGMMGVRVSDAAGEAAVRERVGELAGPEGGVFVSTADEDFGDSVRSALGVLATSLWVFAAVAALAGAVVVGGALSRLAATPASEPSSLAALGLRARDISLVVTVPLAAALALGGAGGAVFGIGGSLLMPVGFARQVEPSPGLDVDMVVVALAALLTALLGTIGAWWSVRRSLTSTQRAAAPVVRRPWLAAFRAMPTTAVGLRHLTATRLDRGVPMRSAFLAALLAVTGVVGSATVVSSLDALAGEPSRYGWAWSSEPDPYEDGHETLAGALAEEPGMDGVGLGTSAVIELGGRETQAQAIEVLRGTIQPTLRAGRSPDGPDEVAIGARTADALGVEIGDTVQATTAAGGATVALDVVGIAVLRPIDNPHPGEGALLTVEGLELVQRSDGFQQVLLRYDDGIDRAAYEAELAERHSLGFSAYSYPRIPGNVANLERATGIVTVLAAFFVAMGSAGAAHALIVSSRRRRRDFAVLTALGFVRRQRSATVVWQAVGLVIVGVVVGLPLGLAGGRLVWSLMVSDLGVLDDPTAPALVLAGLAPGAVVIALLVAAAPARAVRRLSAGSVLRAD